eukprot:TsM_000094400 transcript=TsM_000094400 gene=TsM_000094400
MRVVIVTLLALLAVVAVSAELRIWKAIAKYVKQLEKEE